MRKLFMTVLTLALILGSISMASAASGKVKLTDVADSANEEAIQVAYDLGIVTGTPEGAYEPEKAVNRAEFAALIVRALAVPDSALASYTSTTFKDTSGYGWAVPYLAILQQRGVMKGDGYGNAMPGRTISPNEAVSMVLRAVGYTDNASVLVGQWPANYVALGQNQNLYEDVANDLQMNKASAAQMIYNVLTTQLVQVDTNSLVTLLYDPGDSGTQIPRTLLTTGLNCYRDPGAAGEKKIVTYNDTKDAKINLIPYVGAYGVLYRSKADDEVVALTDVETEFLAGRFYYKSDGTADTFQTVDGT
ncbi:MAG: S-layer homology domain-containing protein, partial [Clostridiales Family XIII bacterium]|nr:S-layer homology domain-containing protein [Clostridiales Family XIII bacterium]